MDATQDVVSPILDSVDGLRARLTPYIVNLKIPMVGSPAAAERVQYGQNKAQLDLFDYATERCRLALDAASDALRGLARLMRLPPLKTSPAGVARAVLESSAIVLWLLDPTSSPSERLGRVVQLREKELEEERKMNQAGLKELPGRKELQDAINWITNQITQFDAQVLKAGLVKKGMVDSTTLAGKQLGAEYEYRIYSNLSHGMPFALRAIRGMYASSDFTMAGATFFYFLQGPADAYCKAVWAFASFMQGGDLQYLRAELGRAYDHLRFNEASKSFFTSVGGAHA